MDRRGYMLFILLAMPIFGQRLELQLDSAGPQYLKYNFNFQQQDFTTSFRGQAGYEEAKNEYLYFPGFSWQSPYGNFSASLAGRDLITTTESKWRIRQVNWNYQGWYLFGRWATLPGFEDTYEWTYKYSGEGNWGHWGIEGSQQEGYCEQWQLPNRASLPWQQLRQQELYYYSQNRAFSWGFRGGYLEEWDRSYNYRAGERLLFWAETTTSPLSLGPLTVAGKGRVQESIYRGGSQEIVSFDTNFNLKGPFPLSLQFRGKNVFGLSPFLCDREGEFLDLAVRSSYSGSLGNWEVFSRYDLLAKNWPQSWLRWRLSPEPFNCDNRIHLNPQNAELLRFEGKYNYNNWGLRFGLELDYDFAATLWNRQGVQFGYSFFNFRYLHRKDYNPQWTGSIKIIGSELICDWWENEETLKITFKPQTGALEFNYWPGSKWQVLRRWDF